MGPQEVARFFRILAKHMEEPVVVTLTGAAAGSAWGHVRASMDIDFGIEPRREREGNWERIEEAIRKTSLATGITAQFSRNIERWGMISIGDYQKHTLPYRTFGRVEVRLLSPAHWAIGKLNRYLEQDAADLRVVFRKQKPDLARTLRLWGKALRASPPSSSSFEFRQRVERFLAGEGRAIWGRDFESERAIRAFRRHAGIPAG